MFCDMVIVVIEARINEDRRYKRLADFKCPLRLIQSEASIAQLAMSASMFCISLALTRDISIPKHNNIEQAISKMRLSRRRLRIVSRASMVFSEPNAGVIVANHHELNWPANFCIDASERVRTIIDIHSLYRHCLAGSEALFRKDREVKRASF